LFLKQPGIISYWEEGVMKLRLIQKHQELHDVCSFVFEPEEPITWEAGQYMHYNFPHPDTDDRGVERWFTISTAPFEKNIRITTRLALEKGSSFKKGKIFI
jgi:ferredoxin-NADP reductase